MKPISIKKKDIEIPFEDDNGEVLETLYFDRSDEKINKLDSVQDEIQKAVNDLGKDGKENDFEAAKEIIKKLTDDLFDEGAFEKIYSLTPSLQVTIVYLYQIFIGIKQEMESEDIDDLRKQLGIE